jgi:streptogramin lyase
MQPSIDQAGNIWFGEMFANALARLNPRTGAVSSWKPPDGQNNIMATAVDGAGNVWFTEQAANYIGRFDPSTAQFTTYPLTEVNGHSAAPQDLKFDAAGNLWFTEVNAAKIGRLNPGTGAITTWSIPALSPRGPSLPFCLAVTSSGSIWFGDLSGGVVGRLDPTSGHVDLVARSGDVWFTSAAANALIRYVPGSRAFTIYQLGIPSSIPFGISFDRQGNLWFTASTNPNYVGAMSTH